jgi:hypothetical protein
VPAVGDWVLVGFTNDRRDNVLMPHSGGKIMKAAANENMTLNHINPTLMCRYVDTTIGWKVLMR